MIFGGDAEGDLYYAVEKEGEAGVFELERLPLGAENTVLVAGVDRPEWQSAPPATITDGSVTFAKIQDIPSGTVIGRVAADAGVSSALSAGDLSTLLTLGDASQVDVADLPGLLGLGTAATADTGTTNGTVPLIGAGDKLAAAVTPWVPMPHVVVTASTATLAPNQRVILGRGFTSGLCTLTLPAEGDFVVNDKIEIIGTAADGFRIAQRAGQSILFNTSQTAVGTGGYIQSLDIGSCLSLVCIGVGTGESLWQVVASQGSSFTVIEV